MNALGSVTPTRPASDRTVNSPASATFAATITPGVLDRPGSLEMGSRDAVSLRVSAMRISSASSRGAALP